MSESLEAKSQIVAEEGSRTSGLAIASFIMAVLSWLALPLLGAIIAVVLGHKARPEIRRSAGRMTGDGLALAGLVLGYANIALAVLVGLCVAGVFVISIISYLYS
jgi:hypothetical protein